ncbi:MAG TPA: hypothetical protein VHY08_04930, partial [Bacillota bacterium]|nr:hypothetical protein [Bacillota bacterium]
RNTSSVLLRNATPQRSFFRQRRDTPRTIDHLSARYMKIYKHTGKLLPDQPQSYLAALGG